MDIKDYLKYIRDIAMVTILVAVLAIGITSLFQKCNDTISNAIIGEEVQNELDSISVHEQP